jgi:hypothetical protein
VRARAQQVWDGLVRLVRDQRGAAYAEAVVMLPVYLAMFALFGLVHNEAHQKMETLAQSRSNAWQRSNGGCEGEDESCPSCMAVEGSDDGTVYGDIDGAINGVGEIPIVGSILEGMLDGLFGSQTTVRASATIERPRLLGGGSRTATSSYTVLCNPVRTSVWEMLRNAFCGFVPFLC